jgi:hypothetical protein
VPQSAAHPGRGGRDRTQRLGRAESQQVQHRRGVPDHIMRLLRRDAGIGPGGQRGGSAIPGTGTMPTVAPTRVRRSAGSGGRARPRHLRSRTSRIPGSLPFPVTWGNRRVPVTWGNRRGMSAGHADPWCPSVCCN